MRLFAALLLFMSLLPAADQNSTVSTVESMLQRAKEAYTQQKSVNAKREARFLTNLKQQEAELQKALDEVARLKAESVSLNATIDANEKILSDLETKLHQRSGNLGELYGVVRQSAGDLFAVTKESPFSAFYPQRVAFLKQLSETKKLPNTKELAHLWYLILEELSLHGKIIKKESDLIGTNGKSAKATLLLNGLFATMTAEGFAQYLPQSKHFALLPKQPTGSALGSAEDAFESSSELFETVLDPTRGQLLALSTQTPGFWERVEQGSTVGYLILLIGFSGLVYAIYRGYQLARMTLAVNTNRPDSLLKQLTDHFDSHKDLALEQLELAMEEQLSKTKTKIEKGLTMIKLLAAVAPLMGLLGTVTGMIATFSAITLFGTGDPKLMAGGISQALITTVEGLIIAIPLLFAYTLLQTRAKLLLSQLEEQALRLLAGRET